MLTKTEKHKTLRVCTYNIWHGGRVKADLGVLGRTLNDLGAHVVGLQEVDVGTARMDGIDTLAVIAQAGGYPYFCFTKAMDYRGGGYGTAILSKYPILSSETIPLVCENKEPRALGCVTIDAEGEKVDFLNTHLSYECKELRARQLAQLADLTGEKRRLILTGDFNTADICEFSVLKGLKTVNDGKFPSFYETGEGIDHIFYTDDFSCQKTEMSREDIVISAISR